MKPIMDSTDSHLEMSYFYNTIMIDNTHFAGAYSDLTDKLHIGLFNKGNPE